MPLNLKIGDPWPFESARGLTGRPCAPVWHALIVPPQKESKAAHKLGNAGVEVQYPTVERVRHVNGKRHDITSPMISQIIYARFEFTPNWDVMRDRRIITGVFSVGSAPVEISDADVRNLMGLPSEADRQEQERIAAMTPDVGERVKLEVGPFKGFFVDVTRVEFGRIWYAGVVGIGAVKGEADVGAITRAAE